VGDNVSTSSVKLKLCSIFTWFRGEVELVTVCVPESVSVYVGYSLINVSSVDVICMTSPDFPISSAKVYTRLFYLSRFVAFCYKTFFTIKLLVSENLWCEQVWNVMHADICSEQAMFLQVIKKSNPL
jgi:hypothetical protein